MHLDPIIPTLTPIVVLVLALALVLRRLHQPHMVAYILAGVVVGPHGLQLVNDLPTMTHLGSIGVTLLLFFVGMEVDIKRLLMRWRIATMGTVLQIVASVGVVWLVGWWFVWPVQRIVLLGFVISLSSTAVVLKLLRETGDGDTKVGRDVTAILLVQDLAIVPMIIVLDFLGSELPSAVDLGRQVGGLILLVLLAGWALRYGHRTPRFISKLAEHDEETRFLFGLLFCFGLAFITGLAGLSTALGAFVAGILVSAMRQTRWIHTSLEPFRILFVGAFFVSVGMLMDLSFLREQWRTVLALAVATLVTNTLLNALVLRRLGDPWPVSFYAGALLAQIGELSFLLAGIGLEARIITDFAYQATVAVIAVTLTVSPAWILLFRWLTGHEEARRRLA